MWEGEAGYREGKSRPRFPQTSKTFFAKVADVQNSDVAILGVSWLAPQGMMQCNSFNEAASSRPLCERKVSAQRRSLLDSPFHADAESAVQDWVHFGLLLVSSPSAPTQLLNRHRVSKLFECRYFLSVCSSSAPCEPGLVG